MSSSAGDRAGRGLEGRRAARPDRGPRARDQAASTTNSRPRRPASSGSRRRVDEQRIASVSWPSWAPRANRASAGAAGPRAARSRASPPRPRREQRRRARPRDERRARRRRRGRPRSAAARASPGAPVSASDSPALERREHLGRSGTARPRALRTRCGSWAWRRTGARSSARAYQPARAVRRHRARRVRAIGHFARTDVATDHTPNHRPRHKE